MNSGHIETPTQTELMFRALAAAIRATVPELRIREIEDAGEAFGMLADRLEDTANQLPKIMVQ